MQCNGIFVYIISACSVMVYFISACSVMVYLYISYLHAFYSVGPCLLVCGSES